MIVCRNKQATASTGTRAFRTFVQLFCSSKKWLAERWATNGSRGGLRSLLAVVRTPPAALLHVWEVWNWNPPPVVVVSCVMSGGPHIWQPSCLMLRWKSLLLVKQFIPKQCNRLVNTVSLVELERRAEPQFVWLLWADELVDSGHRPVVASAVKQTHQELWTRPEGKCCIPRMPCATTQSCILWM